MAYLDIYMYWNKKLSKRVLRNHVIKISKFTVKSSYLGYLRRKCILVKFDFFFGKSNFHRAYPIYDDFIIIIIFPAKRCTDSSMEKNYLKSIFFRPKTPYIWFSTKKFSERFFLAGIDTAFREEYCNDGEIVISRVCTVKIAFWWNLISFSAKAIFTINTLNMMI